MSVSFSTPGNGYDDLNVSNMNFYRLMDLLGYEDVDCCGDFRGDDLVDLRNRIESALTLFRMEPSFDAGVPAHEVPNPGGCRIIDCGVSQGYYAHRFTALLAIVESAIANGNPVTFG